MLRHPAKRESVFACALGAFAALAAPVLAIACSDSLHLDPDAGTGGSGPGSTVSAGGGGAGPISCVSNAGCPAPTAICDQVTNTCVECLELEHCGFRPGTVCSEGACVCPEEGASYCEGYAKPFEARPARCVDLQTSSSDCGSCGHACFGACGAGKCVDAWEPTPFADAPSPRARAVCAWTGSSFVAWGGDVSGGFTSTGGVLTLAEGTWTPTSQANAPSPRSYAKGVWTGDRLIVWGGYDGTVLGTGAVYDPKTNTWKPMSGSGAPPPRYLHTAVWVSSVMRMLVWGGYNNTDNLSDGGQYDPVADKWTPITDSGAPDRRREHVAVSTGDHMLVHGGIGFDGVDDNVFLSTGKSYDPAGDTWLDIDTTNAPGPRARHAAAWSGSEMLVWGGERSGNPPYWDDGGGYGSAWTPMGGTPPMARRYPTAVWIDAPIARFAVWGGETVMGRAQTGGLFDPAPAANTWEPKPMPTAPSARVQHCAVAAGARMLVWGGDTASGLTNTGGVFDPALQ